MKIAVLSGISAFFLSMMSSHGQGTMFTYQGILTDDGQMATGDYGMVFYLCDNPTSGGHLANLGIASVPVSNGVFTVTLDFGDGMFPGADRWLEIAVQTNGAASFTTLSPRQKITAAPYAITAASISSVLPASQISGQISLTQLPDSVVTNNQSAELSIDDGTSSSTVTASNVATPQIISTGPSNFFSGVVVGNTPPTDTNQIPRLFELLEASNSLYHAIRASFTANSMTTWNPISGIPASYTNLTGSKQRLVIFVEWKGTDNPAETILTNINSTAFKLTYWSYARQTSYDESQAMEVDVGTNEIAQVFHTLTNNVQINYLGSYLQKLP